MKKITWITVPLVLGIVSYFLLFGDIAGRLNAMKGSLEDDHANHPMEDSFCCSTFDEISQGTDALVGLLNKITSRPFFRFFKVNLEKPCPYWAVQLLCTGEENACQVCSCDANDVPEALRYPYDMSDPSVVEGRVSFKQPNPSNVDKWGIWKESGDDASYVDLLQNPEGNTGYTGPLAAKVWQAIYKENCMTSAPKDISLVENEECKEEKVFQKLISGLHTSIGMQVATFFHKDKDGISPLLKAGVLKNNNISFFPNCQMYGRMVMNEEYTKNLYVLFQFILRALAKAKGRFMSDLDSYNSGVGGVATDEDLQLQNELNVFFSSHLLCSKTFDEAKFLESPRAHYLVPQMKRMMLNITTLMDCVTCEKCRVWGKLQTMGLATALKIVMLPSQSTIQLSRGEKVSMMNFARQLAVSVKSVKLLANVCKDDLHGKEFG